MIGIVFQTSCGATFLDWSLRYISNSVEFYHVDTKSYLNVVDNPILSHNAHNHRRNEANNYEDLLYYQKIFNTVKSSTYHSSKIDTGTRGFLRYRKDVKNAYINDQIVQAQKMIKLLNDNNDDIVILNSSIPLYSINQQLRGGRTNQSYDNDANLDIFYHYTDDIKEWGDINTTWDKREYLALNMRFLKSYLPDIDINVNHFIINDVDMFYNLNHTTLEQLMVFLNIPYTNDKMIQWNKVYVQWQKIHQQRMQFAFYFNQIIHYIINGYSMDLTRFMLDLYQEAAIQHILIYEHNLTIKNWKLEKFLDTKDIYNLLEENKHKICL